MTLEEAKKELNKFRNNHYNDGVDDKDRLIAQALNEFLPYMVRLEKLMVKIVMYYVCGEYYRTCSDCYFYKGKCMLWHRIDIDEKIKLVVEWLEKEVENYDHT